MKSYLEEVRAVSEDEWIKCPYCGHKNREDFDWIFNEMKQSHWHCNSCGTPFNKKGEEIKHKIYPNPKRGGNSE
jgi:DNA-directed RNA polymerase subunit RPC12/RpoP